MLFETGKRRYSLLGLSGPDLKAVSRYRQQFTTVIRYISGPCRAVYGLAEKDSGANKVGWTQENVLNTVLRTRNMHTGGLTETGCGLIASREAAMGKDFWFEKGLV